MPGNHAHHTLLNHRIYHTHNTCFNYQIDMRPCEHENVSVQLWYSIAQCILMGLNGCIPCNRFFSVFCIVHALSAAIYQHTVKPTHALNVKLIVNTHTSLSLCIQSLFPSLLCRVPGLLVWKLLVRSNRQHSTIRTHPYIYNHSHLQSMLHLLIQIKNKLKPTLSFTNSSTMSLHHA